MFKYGSFRNFIVKFLIGVFLFGFGSIYLISLYSYSQNDPGFNQINFNINENKVENFFGFFGAYLSSYSLIFIGTLSYVLAFFLIALNIVAPPFACTVIYLHFFKSFRLSIADIAVCGISFIFKSNQKSLLKFSKNFLWIS